MVPDSNHGGVDPTRISRLVEHEAKRVLTESQLRADPALVAEGWERRFVTDIRRLEEVTDLYRQLGFEVRTEPIVPEDVGDQCGDCQLVRIQFRMVYTRTPSTRSTSDTDNLGDHPA